ncbi:MAG: AMP-binding protein [Acidobacteriota bacterium]
MSLSTLIDLLPEMHRLGKREALRFHNAFRTWRLTYQELWKRIAGFCCFLDERGLGKGDRLILWSQNCPEWVIVFWASVARGIEVVPLDFHSSPRFVERVQREVNARLLVTSHSIFDNTLPVDTLSVLDLAEIPGLDELKATPVGPGDVVEIVYTSGTTGDPQGVVHRHRNICANLNPIRAEIARYEKYARPFQPIRLLTMLPLSHMFGQALGLFAPVLLGGASVFMTELHPGAMVETIRREKVSVLGTVPRLVDNLRHELERQFDLSHLQPLGRGWTGAARRWWRFRKIHRLFGLKFWCLIVGGAPLRPELESFWSRLGFFVMQGYGLTESSPVVSVNHPFRARPGSIGKSVAGQEVCLAPDGEILVRGESVATQYVGSATKAGKLLRNGWLHTGDIGEIDGQGNLYYRGRKKDVIVTSAGLNVYPQDIESVLNGMPEIRDSAVVGVLQRGRESVHAALILADLEVDPAQLVARANQDLEFHQRIQSWSLWPDEDFPRTPSTYKVKRSRVAAQIVAQQGAEPGKEKAVAGGLVGILSSLSGRKIGSGGTALRLAEDLGLSSLDRVELLSQLEDHYAIQLEEARFAHLSTIPEVQHAIDAAREAKASGQGRERKLTPMPRWTRRWPFPWIRAAALDVAILPLLRNQTTLSVQGVEHLERVNAPVIFAANHNSHLDTPALLAALPPGWRRRLTPAMQQDRFLAHFQPQGFTFGERLAVSGQYLLACGLFNAYPLPQRMGGVRQTLRYSGELIEQACCPLIFPEGRRSATGRLQSFQPGVGLMALQLRVPVVPVYIAGTYEILSLHQRRPRAGRIRVVFGRPLGFKGVEDPHKAAQRVEAAIRELGAL